MISSGKSRLGGLFALAMALAASAGPAVRDVGFGGLSTTGAWMDELSPGRQKSRRKAQWKGEVTRGRKRGR